MLAKVDAASKGIALINEEAQTMTGSEVLKAVYHFARCYLMFYMTAKIPVHIELTNHFKHSTHACVHDIHADLKAKRCSTLG